MRSALFAVLVAGCSGFGPEALEGDGDGDRVPDPPICVIDADCSVASTSCCACPTFATTAGNSADCDPIACPELIDCAPTEAVCDDGACRLRCVEIEPSAMCDRGFEVDAAGCAIDACAGDEPECQLDGDCAIAPADCCGCELGGSDTAVPASALDAHLAALDCAGESFCPGIDACDEAATARCLGGTCRLVSGSDFDEVGAVCGTPDAPSCPAGELCVLNHPSAPPGVAICRQL